MPAPFLQSVLIQDEALAVSTTITDDLPINPLSHILLTLRMLNDTGTTALADDYRPYSQILNAISRVEVLYRGSAIISASLVDLAVAYMVLTGRQLWPGAMNHADNERRDLTIPIPLGRRLFDRNECFPATKKGELQLQITSAAAQTGVDTLVLQAETVELLDAAPQRHLKMTVATKDPGGIQEEDLDLPIGNLVAGVLLFSTTVPKGAVATEGIGNVQMLVNNVQRYFPRTNWETLHGALTQRMDPLVLNGHVHALLRSAVAGTAPQAVSIADGVAGDMTGGVGATGAGVNLPSDTNGLLRQVNVADFIENYAYMDLDPLNDLSYALDTLGLSRFHLRISHETDEVMRALPIELVRL